MPQEIPVSVQRRLKSNFKLRAALVIAFGVLWLLPVVYHLANSGTDLSLMYGQTWHRLFSGSVALFAGFLTLLFQRRRIVAEYTVEAGTAPAATPAA